MLQKLASERGRSTANNLKYQLLSVPPCKSAEFASYGVESKDKRQDRGRKEDFEVHEQGRGVLNTEKLITMFEQRVILCTPLAAERGFKDNIFKHYCSSTSRSMARSCYLVAALHVCICSNTTKQMV